MSVNTDVASLREGLVKAKHLIRKPVDWGKGDGFANPPVDGMCAMNAACEANYALEAHIVRALQQELPEGPWMLQVLPVASYNDDPATTHADIMDLFDRAISALDIKEMTSIANSVDRDLAATREVPVSTIVERIDYHGMMLDAAYAAVPPQGD